MDSFKKLYRYKYKFFQHTQTEPSDFYQSVVITPNNAARFVGLDVFTEGYKFSWRTFCMIVSILVYIYCCVFTAYEVRCSVKELIFCLVTSGLAPHKTVHVWTFLMFRKELYWFHQYTKDLYREECKDRTKSMLMKNVSLLSVTTKLMLVAYTCISSAMDIVPIISSAASGEKTLPFGFYIPFLDHTSSPGFTCNFIIHVTLTVYVLCSGYGADCIYLIAMASSFTQIDVLMSALRELTTEIEAKKSDVGECLNQIIVRHQEHLK